MTEPLLTTDQTAALMGCKRDTVLRRIHSGQLRGINIGTEQKPRYRVRPADLEAYLDASVYATSGEQP